jgi:hypothetical protein
VIKNRMNLELSLIIAILAWITVFVNILIAFDQTPLTKENMFFMANVLIFVPIGVAYIAFKLLYRKEDCENEQDNG